MPLRPTLVLLLALVLPAAHAWEQAPAVQGEEGHKASTLPLEASPTQADAAQLSARFLTRFHYEAKPLDDAMSAKVYKAYFDMLDGEKVFFTQQDMARFEPLKTKFDDAIWNKDLSGPFSVFNLYVRRAVDRMTFARGLLKQGF